MIEDTDPILKVHTMAREQNRAILLDQSTPNWKIRNADEWKAVDLGLIVFPLGGWVVVRKKDTDED